MPSFAVDLTETDERTRLPCELGPVSVELLRATLDFDSVPDGYGPSLSPDEVDFFAHVRRTAVDYHI